MNTVYFKKTNQSWAKFGSDNDGILQEISDYFSFESPGARFDYRVRNHLWDGYIRLANLKTRVLPAGLKQHLYKFCQERNYSFEDCTESVQLIPEEDLSHFDDWIESLHLPFPPYDYQLNAVKHALITHNTLLLSPTGSGKSMIIYLIMRWMHAHNRRMCILVPSTSLVEQMLKDFKEYSQNDPGFDASKEIQGLYSKLKTDPYKSNLLVSTWQSVFKYEKSLYAQWDCILCDECHLVSAKSLQKICHGAINAKYRYGTTGSLSGLPMHEWVIVGCLGPVYKVATTKELQELGRLSSMSVYVLMLKYSDTDSKYLYRTLGKDYPTEVQYINSHKTRLGFVCNLACSLTGTVMVLFRMREQGQSLYQLISEKSKESRPVFYIDGRIKAEQRESIREAINNKGGAILVASVGTSATGLNIPSIENVILCPSKSRVRNLQSIGRGLRLYDNKSKCNIFDLVDDLSFGRHKNYSLKWGVERYQLYQEEGFNVIFKNVQF